MLNHNLLHPSKKLRCQKIPSKTFFPLIFRQSGHYIGVKKIRIGERSCRKFKTKSQEAVNNVSDKISHEFIDPKDPPGLFG